MHNVKHENWIFFLSTFVEVFEKLLTSGRANAIQDPKLRLCSGNWEERKPTRMRFGGVPGYRIKSVNKGTQSKSRIFDFI